MNNSDPVKLTEEILESGNSAYKSLSSFSITDSETVELMYMYH